MLSIAGVLVIPAVIGIIYSLFNKQSDRYYYRSTALNWLEYAVQFVFVALLGVGGWFIFRDSQFHSLEFLNGEIAGKDYVDGSCSHCTTYCTAHDEDGNCTASYTVCDHDFDRSWRAWTNYAEWFPREGTIWFSSPGQGLQEPVEWTTTQIGESATTLHKFDSYLKPSGESDAFPIPEGTLERYANLVPPKTTELAYGRIHAVKVLAVGYDSLPPGFVNANVNNNQIVTNWQMNDWVEDSNQILGPSQQANVQFIFVYAEKASEDYGEFLLGTWRGAGKNDVNIIIGTSADISHISWVDVQLGATDVGNEFFVTAVEEAVLEIRSAQDSKLLVDTVHARVMEEFNRKEMAEFADRKAGVHPTTVQLVILYIIVIFACIGLNHYFYNNDPFEIE